MQVIHWPELQPLPADLEALRERLKAALSLGSVCRLLVEVTLRAYPWTERADLIPCYHPSQTYQQGQRIALFIFDPQNARRRLWLPVQVRSARFVENAIQGRFQVLTLDVQGRLIQMAGGVAGASYPQPDLSRYTGGDLAWLVEWVSETYAASFQATLKRLIQNGGLRGRLAGETFLPEPLSALSPELLQPCFARLSPAQPWVSLAEIHKGLPDLSRLERETTLGLLRAALKAGPYRSLGGERWTTPALFKQLDRDVPIGLPRSHVHSIRSAWTKQDQQDLAGYDGPFMPPEARSFLEELGILAGSSERDPSPWRPPPDPLRLPALSYLHSTQGYFPVRGVMRSFPPDAKMVFVQFTHGEHRPFLLDREQGLLKAVQAEELHTRILEEDIPAGTTLWLEHQGSEQYRIAPRPLAFKRRVPGKLASLEQGQLHIAHTYMSMQYEGVPSLFKTHLRFEEIEALFAEASRLERSLRAAIIYAIQEICGTDPDHRAHRQDIFNAVFLQRRCSPTSVAVLLYTQPCFESLGGGYFRYKPMPDTIITTPKRNDRLSQLWDDLLADPVAPHPAARQRTTVGARFEVSYAAPRSFTSDRKLPSRLSLSETDPELPLTARSYTFLEEDTAATTALQEEERIEPVLLNNDEPDPFLLTDETESTGTWRDNLGKLFHSLVELEDVESPALPADEANPELEVFSDMSMEAAHAESLSLSSPFRWEPKPAWIQPPTPQNSPSLTPADPRLFVSRPKIPIRPLHKQPFYKRYFFYLRRWLGRNSRKTG